jgi:hypothetical protein
MSRRDRRLVPPLRIPSLCVLRPFTGIRTTSQITDCGGDSMEPGCSSSRTERSGWQVRWSAAFRHVRVIGPGHDQRV